MRIRFLAAFALLAVSGGCAGLDSGWHLTRGLRPADGTRISKMQPIALESGTGAADTGGKLVYVGGSIDAAAGAQAFNRYGGLERVIPLAAWRGKRLRVSLRLKNEEAARAYIMAQIDRFDGDAIRTQVKRSAAGSGVWETQQLVLDVPADASELLLYAGFNGKGALWLDGVTLEAAGSEAPLTPSMMLAALPNARYRGCNGGYGNCSLTDQGYNGYVYGDNGANPYNPLAGLAQSTITDLRASGSLPR